MEDFQPHRPGELKEPWPEAANPMTISCSCQNISLNTGPSAHSQPCHLVEAPGLQARTLHLVLICNATQR